MLKTKLFKFSFITLIMLQLMVVTLQSFFPLSLEAIFTSLPDSIENLLRGIHFVFYYIPTAYCYFIIVVVSGVSKNTFSPTWIVISSVPIVLLYSYIFSCLTFFILQFGFKQK